MPLGADARARNSCGTWMRMPAPSPVLSSQPQAPRWLRFSSAVEAVVDDLVRLLALRGRRRSRRRSCRARCGGRRGLLGGARWAGGEASYVPLVWWMLSRPIVCSSIRPMPRWSGGCFTAEAGRGGMGPPDGDRSYRRGASLFGIIRCSPAVCEIEAQYSRRVIVCERCAGRYRRPLLLGDSSIDATEVSDSRRGRVSQLAAFDGQSLRRAVNEASKPPRLRADVS